MGHLSRYILRAHVGPFFFSVSTLMFLFLLQFVMKFIDQLVGKGLTAWVIIELIALNLSWMLVLAVPMSVLVSTLMAFGDLSSRNEITAMKAGGVSTYRMMLPVLGMASVIAILLVLFNNYVLPESNHELKTLTMDIRRTRPTLTLVNGVFSQDIPGYSILVRKSYPKTNELEGVTLYDYTNPNVNVVITAETGRISFSPDYRKLIMDLHDGEIHELGLQTIAAYRRIHFDTHRIVMDVEGFDFSRSAAGVVERGDREMSAHEMRTVVDSLRRNEETAANEVRRVMEDEMSRLLNGATAVRPFRGAPTPITNDVASFAEAQIHNLSTTVTTSTFVIDNLESQISKYEVEIHKKYSIPVACIVFVLVGAPLGIMARKGGFGIAATLSLGFFVLYWAFLIGGEKMADRGILSPFWSMWAANVIIGIIGLYLTVRIARESMLIQWDTLQRFIPRRMREMFKQEEETPAET